MEFLGKGKKGGVFLLYFQLKDYTRQSWRKTTVHGPRRTAHGGNGHINLQASGIRIICKGSRHSIIEKAA
jgi:hypothetical protein